MNSVEGSSETRKVVDDLEAAIQTAEQTADVAERLRQKYPGMSVQDALFRGHLATRHGVINADTAAMQDLRDAHRLMKHTDHNHGWD